MNHRGLRALSAIAWVAAATFAAGAIAAPASETTRNRVLTKAELVPGVKFPELDFQKIAAEDSFRDESFAPKRFAIGRDLAVTPATDGAWKTLPDGRLQWRYSVRTPDAAHLNFGFTKWKLPAGATLTIVSPDSKDQLGPWGAEENKASGQFWTPVLFGHSAIIEVIVPADQRDALGLELGRVGHGYRGFGTKSMVCKAGSCNTDVACLTAGDPWNGPRRAVGAYTRGGTDTCTGSLLNNAAEDRRMLFATASHCNILTNAAAASVVVYWNYESPTCRRPGSSESGTVIPRPTDPVNITNGVSFIAATRSPFISGDPPGPHSDFALIQLDPADPTPQPNLHWAGWDRRLGSTNEPPGSTTATWPCASTPGPFLTEGLCAGIHHPGVDEKRITFVASPFSVDDISNGRNVHWRANWIASPALPAFPPGGAIPVSVTERGSSGSPLYNADKRLVGVLSGGPSACGNNQYNDQYGQLAHAWNGVSGATSAERMRDHLDPGNAALFFINGVDRCTPPSVPTLVTASAPAANQVSVSFTGAGGAERYRVLRAIGACPGGAFTQIGETTTTTFIDTMVSGGTTYSYRLRSFDDGEQCESGDSDCASVAATGLCTRAPDFSGAIAASSAGSATCGVNVSWTAATSTCAPAGNVRYNVYRSTNAAFTPDASNLIASCLTGTSLLDTNFESAGVVHYIVRVEDAGGSGTGACAGGLTDANLVRRAVTPAGPETIAFADEVDPVASPPLWTTAGSSGAGSNFAVIVDPLVAANSVWFTLNPNEPTDRRLAQVAAVAVPAGGGELEIIHRFSTEATYDGGVIEYSLDGTTWTDVLAAQGAVPANPARFIANGYNGPLAGGANPLAGRQGWQGSSAGFATGYITSRINLADFAGLSVRFRFRFGADASVGGEGWWIDRVRVFAPTSCTAIPEGLIFRNGFEQ